jgi:hypothetical protein
MRHPETMKMDGSRHGMMAALFSRQYQLPAIERRQWAAVLFWFI